MHGSALKAITCTLTARGTSPTSTTRIRWSMALVGCVLTTCGLLQGPDSRWQRRPGGDSGRLDDEEERALVGGDLLVHRAARGVAVVAGPHAPAEHGRRSREHEAVLEGVVHVAIEDRAGLHADQVAARAVAGPRPGLVLPEDAGLDLDPLPLVREREGEPHGGDGARTLRPGDLREQS